MDTHNRPPKLMDRVKATMRVKRFSTRTEKTYCYWIRYFRFHGVRHPASMGGSLVRAFLEHLAVERQVAAATQNQALNAIVFLYRHVLEQPLGEIGEFSRAKRPRRLPVVLSHEEVMLSLISGTLPPGNAAYRPPHRGGYRPPSCLHRTMLESNSKHRFTLGLPNKPSARAAAS
ncbi:phage integrase N-terminal SAM-like domain-containing protein [Billgrantia antri]|uniref:phage integrase N-terminal SAM-like domain-containing protein n=1 Tax=Billgrantia antri TaxID=2846777 RepID=UPI003B21980E